MPVLAVIDHMCATAILTVMAIMAVMAIIADITFLDILGLSERPGSLTWKMISTL